MTNPTAPYIIATTTRWQKNLLTDDTFTHETIQAAITNYVRQSDISIVGYHTEQPSSLTLLRWPDLREGYQEPSIDDCELAVQSLESILDAKTQQQPVTPESSIHTMMGRRVGGYDTNVIEPITTVKRLAPNLTITEGFMVSARTITDGVKTKVEEYGEPVAIMTGDAQHETEIHAVGDALKQHHYVIERGSGATDFYETKWAILNT